MRAAPPFVGSFGSTSIYSSGRCWEASGSGTPGVENHDGLPMWEAGARTRIEICVRYGMCTTTVAENIEIILPDTPAAHNSALEAIAPTGQQPRPRHRG